MSRISTAEAVNVEIHKRVLRNGLTCLAIRTDSAPTVSIGISFEVDQRAESPEQIGIGHLLGEVLDEGTEKYDGDALAEQVEGLGAELSCGASGASIHCSVDDYKKALRLLREVVVTPTFPAAAVKRARSLVKAELAAEEEEPRTVAAKRFRELVYGQHPFALPNKGTRDTVAKLSPAQLRKFHSACFVPSNGIVAGVGKLDPNEMLDGLQRTFSSWKGPRFELEPAIAPEWPKRSRSEHIEFDSQQSHVFLGHLGIRRSDPDYYKLVVMDHVLGSGPGFTSRIARKLRDEQGLCYTVGASVSSTAGREPGLFTAYIGTSPHQVKQATRGFLDEMHAIRNEAPGPQELADVQAYLTGSYVWGLERNPGLVGFAIRVERFGLGEDYLVRYPEWIRAVTCDDVREAAERHLDPKRYTLVTLGPA